MSYSDPQHNLSHRVMFERSSGSSEALNHISTSRLIHNQFNIYSSDLHTLINTLKSSAQFCKFDMKYLRDIHNSPFIRLWPLSCETYGQKQPLVRFSLKPTKIHSSSFTSSVELLPEDHPLFEKKNTCRTCFTDSFRYILGALGVFKQQILPYRIYNSK